MDENLVGRALNALEKVNVVLCPDLDGGYNLVGVRRSVPGLFDHAMSTERVLRDTVQRAQAAGSSVALLPKGFDIDVASDLTYMRSSEHAMRTCSRSVAYLDRHALWPPRGEPG